MARRNRPPIPISIAAISACVCALAGTARAQSAEAQARFDDGARLLKAGKLAEACDAFETSNRLEPRAGTLLRLGECREANHQLASAWSAYDDALTKATDPKKKTFASGRLKLLAPKLSHLTIAVKSRVAGLAIERNGVALDPGLWNAPIPIDGGDYAISAKAPGHVAWSKTVSVPIENGQISVDVPALADAPAPVVAPVAQEAPSAPPSTDRTEPAPAHGLTTRRKLAIGVLAGGAAATVVGALLGSSAGSKKDQAYQLCPDPTTPCSGASAANSLINDAHSRAIDADLAFGVAVTAAAVAGVLWFTGAPEEHAHVEATATAHGGGLAIVGRF